MIAIALVVGSSCWTSMCSAQAPNNRQNMTPEQRQQQYRLMLQRYDINKNGRLDAPELARMREAIPQLQYNTASITATGNVQGDIIKFGNTTTKAGAIYAHTGSGWVLAHSGSNGNASSSLGFAVGTNSTTKIV